MQNHKKRLMTFELRGQFSFEAIDLNDAFHKLAEHFNALASYRETDLIQSGYCEVGKLKGSDVCKTN